MEIRLKTLNLSQPEWLFLQIIFKIPDKWLLLSELQKSLVLKWLMFFGTMMARAGMFTGILTNFL
jgi:hypothetical protein